MSIINVKSGKLICAQAMDLRDIVLFGGIGVARIRIRGTGGL
jgi:hypothetical protein